MAGAQGGRAALRGDINVTPLVDVVLVLLIIFMVITPLVQRGHAVQVPPAATAPGNPAVHLVVRLARDGSVVLNAERVANDELPALLRGAVAARGQGVTLVAAAGELPYDRVARFIDACKSAAGGELGIVLGDLGSP